MGVYIFSIFLILAPIDALDFHNNFLLVKKQYKYSHTIMLPFT